VLDSPFILALRARSMPLTEPIKNALKRGALVTAANWQVVLIQFVAESAFKALLIVPVVGAAFLVTLLVGSSVEEIVSGDLRQTLGIAIAALGEHRAALGAYLAGVGVVLVGGSILMFVVKAGSVGVLVDADRAGPAVERPPLRVDTVRQAERFSGFDNAGISNNRASHPLAGQIERKKRSAKSQVSRMAASTPILNRAKP